MSPFLSLYGVKMKQLHAILFGILALIGAAYFVPAHADVIGCKVYATQPSNAFAVNSTPQVPCDKNGSIWTNTAAAAGGTSSNFGASAPSAGTAVGFLDSTGLLMAPGKVDSNNNIDVNCTVGCAGGSFNNNADAVATSSTNGQNAAWLYAFNGTSWDRLRDDGSKNLDVNINAASSPVGVTGTFWQATQPISAASLPLPSGAATSALQTTGNTALSTINSTLGSPMQNSGGSVTANLGTLNGAATAALQTTGNTALGTINSTLGSPMQNSGGTVIATQATGTNLHVVCDSGCAGSGGTASNFGSTFPSAGTAAGYNDDTTGDMVAGTVNHSDSGIDVHITNGGSGGTSSSFGSAFPSIGTAIGATNGTNMVALKADGSNNLNVNCQVGCAGGSFNNNADAVATSSTNGQNAAWLYAFNGTSWDRLRDDASKNLDVNVQVSALPSGAATSALQTTGNTALSTINTTLGSPMQNSGGSVTANLGTLNGAATAAKQPAIGTAGSASADVLSVQGISGGTAIPVQGTFWQTTQPISAASLPLPSNAAEETGGNLATLAGGVSSSKYQENLATIAGTAVDVNSGNKSAGTQRMVIATDQPVVAGLGGGVVGSAVPADAEYSAGISSGNLTGIIQADNSVPVSMSTATTTQFIALSSGKKTYITSFDFIANGATNVTIEYGTGTNCGTLVGTATGAYPLTAQAGISKGTGLGPVLVIPASDAVCILQSGGVQLSGSISYTQF